jgi:hypothetical protein
MVWEIQIENGLEPGKKDYKMIDAIVGPTKKGNSFTGVKGVVKFSGARNVVEEVKAMKDAITPLNTLNVVLRTRDGCPSVGIIPIVTCWPGIMATAATAHRRWRGQVGKAKV